MEEFKKEGESFFRADQSKEEIEAMEKAVKMTEIIGENTKEISMEEEFKNVNFKKEIGPIDEIHEIEDKLKEKISLKIKGLQTILVEIAEKIHKNDEKKELLEKKLEKIKADLDILDDKVIGGYKIRDDKERLEELAKIFKDVEEKQEESKNIELAIKEINIEYDELNKISDEKELEGNNLDHLTYPVNPSMN